MVSRDDRNITNELKSGESSGSSLVQQTYERIKQDILTHELLPREPLVEAQLAATYKVSKTPVREALLSLAREGIVEMSRFRGGRVRDFTARDAREIYELRIILEPLAVERAVPRMATEDLALVRSTLSEAREAAERGDQQKLSQLNREFHTRLASYCDNSRIVGTLEQLQDQIRVMTLRFWKVRATYLEEAEQHEAILAAAEIREAEYAAELMHQHIVRFRDRYVREWN